MIRALLKLVLIVVVLVAAAAFFFGYSWGRPEIGDDDRRPVATTGEADRQVDINRERARETGARVGEAVAAGASQAERLAQNARLTTKITSKMALDDTIEAKWIDVDSADGTVTLSGRVRSEAERQRALQLARETEGVKNVVDRLTVER